MFWKLFVSVYYFSLDCGRFLPYNSIRSFIMLFFLLIVVFSFKVGLRSLLLFMLLLFVYIGEKGEIGLLVIFFIVNTFFYVNNSGCFSSSFGVYDSTSKFLVLCSVSGCTL